MESVKFSVIAAATAGVVAAVAQAAPPLLPGQLQLNATLNVATAAGEASNNTDYNPRIYGNYNYVTQIGDGGQSAIGRFLTGSSTADAAVQPTGTIEHRMTTGLGANYWLASGGNNNFTWTRYDSNGANPVSVTSPGGATTANNSFDWIDTDTLISATYQPSGDRDRLYMIDVVDNPFSMSLNTSVFATGYFDSGAARIRNVRVGDLYSNFAYYGNAANLTDTNFYALNLTTGAETLLGNLGTLTASHTGSSGLWTVKEVDGYLYVHTVNNGVTVFNMNSGDSLGSVYTTYSVNDLKTAIGEDAALVDFHGFDVSPDGSRILVSAYPNDGGTIQTYELIPEPASLGLLGLAGAALLRRRK